MSNQIVITSGAKLRDLDDVIIGTDGILSSVAFNVANGVPRLDENGKILVSQLPNSVMEFKGVWNAATNTPTLANGTGNAGDVWLCNVAGTVNFGAGPIAFAVGDYAVYTGTVWARSSGATGTVTSVGVSRDGNALAITGSPVTSSGTINLGFSGDNTQYINGAGNLTTFPTLITSIGLTMPAAFGVSNSPLTANGTIGVTALGYPSQYIRGDGTLADFPTSGGGGSSVSYYLNGGTSQGTIGGVTYYEMSKTADTGTGVDFSKTGDGLITAFLTDAGDPALLQIPAGNWNYEIYASMSSNGGTPEMYAELYVYDGTTFTLLSTSAHEILYDGVNLNLYTFAMAVPETVLTVTDRLAIKLYATNSGGKTTTIHTQDSHLCQIITTFTTGLTALNGLTAQVQYFGTGTSGSDFNIVSSVDTHTFNIPSASATARGLITTGTQTIAGSKTITGTTTFTGGPILSDTNLTYANSGYTLVLQSPTLSVNRTVTLPNGTGTLALTSDISYPVTSVFGRTGAVVATSGDYTTTQVTEGLTNLYFTDARARTAISLTTTGSTGAATYNNTTGVLNIPNYADQYVGTVTSVGLSAPTGFSVSGSPVTSSGTLALAFASGYSLPTNVKQSNWDDAYTWVAAFPTQTGNNGKFLTTDGSSLSWAANPLGTVTSVDMSVPTGLTVSGNPITTSGTLAVTLTAGYSIPTTANQSTWTTAYNRSLTSAAVTGTTTKTLTLNQQDGGTITASWTDINTDAVTSVFGRTGAVVATEGDYTLTQLGDVTITSPTTGQVLKYNGTAWINDTDANTGTVTSVAMTVPTGLSIAGSPITSSGTLAVTFAAGYSIPTNASQTTWDTAYTNRITSLTTTGTSGAATLIANVLNIPNYTTDLSGYVTLATTQTITGDKNFTSGAMTMSPHYFTNMYSTNDTYVHFYPSGGNGANFSAVNWRFWQGTGLGAKVLYAAGNGTFTWDTYTIYHSGNSNTITSLGTITTGVWNGTAIADAYIASASTWNAKQGAITLTTTGTSGAATFTSNTLNIPNYGSALSGYLPLTGGTLTGPLNGTTAVFGTSVLSQDYRFNGSGYITYNVDNVGTNTFILRNNGTTVLNFDASNKATFASDVTATQLLLSTSYAAYTYNDQFELRNEAVWRLRLQSHHNGGGYDYRIVQNNNGADINVMTFINGNINVIQAATFSSTINSGAITASALSRIGDVYIGGKAGTYAAYADGVFGDNLHLGATGAGGAVYINSALSRNVYINPVGGNVGINQTAASAKLDIYAGADSTASTVLWGQIIRNEGNGPATGYGAGLKLKISSDGTPNEIYKWAGIAAVAGTGYSNRTDLVFYTNAASTSDATIKVRIDGDGNVGIGQAPSFKLDVNGSGNFNGTLYVTSGTTNAAIIKGDGAFDGATRFYLTNNAYIYGRTNLVLTGRLDASNDGYSFGTNSRNSIVFNVNEGGAQGATGTEYYGIQLQLVTKALYFQSKYGNDNGLQGFVFSEDNQLRIRNTTSYGDYALQVTGAVYSSAAITATSFFESSDIRLKTLIQDNYQTKGIDGITPKLYTKNGKVELGYYAQDFIGVLDNAISKGSDDMLSLSYREVHTAKIYALEQEIKQLKAKLN